MTELARIGFRAETGDLSEAKIKLDALPNSAGRAEKSSARLARIFDLQEAAASKLMAAATGLVAASDRLAAAEGRATVATTKKTKAVDDAAAATAAAAKASALAAAAAQRETDAINQAAAARKNYSRSGVPLIGQTRAAQPWGAPGDNSSTTRPAAGMPANDNLPMSYSGKGSSSFNVGNIAAQFQDVGVTAAMGMNPLMIALQQGTQLSAVLQTMEKPLQGIASAFAAIISPVSLLTIGFIALAAAGLQLVNWTKVAQAGLRALATIMPELTVAATVVGGALLVAFGPSIVTAIGAVAFAIEGLLVKSFLLLVSTIGAIPLALIAAIGVAFYFSDEIEKAVGVDVVKSFRDAGNKIIGIFVGAFKLISAQWKQLPVLFSAVSKEAVNEMIAAFEGPALTINGMTVIGGLDLSSFKMQLSEAEKAAMNTASVVFDQSVMQTDYIGAIADAGAKAGKKLNEWADTLGKTDDKKKRGKTEQQKYDDILVSAQGRINSLSAERDALFLTEEASAALKYETDLLNDAMEKGIVLTPERTAQLKAAAGEMATLETETRKTRDAIDFVKDGFKGFLNDIRSGLAEGKTLWQAFGDAALNILDKIVNKITDELVNALFSASSGSGGILQSIVGLFTGGAVASAKGNVFGSSGVTAFAAGGVVNGPTLFGMAGGRTGLMGEAGPEAVMPLKRGPDGSLGVQMHQTGRETPAPVYATYAPNVRIEAGATQEAVAALAKAMEKQQREFAQNTIKTIEQANKRNVGY